MIEEKLKQARPRVPKDPAFLSTLRNKLIPSPMQSTETTTSLPYLRQFMLAASGAVIAIIIAVPLTYQVANGHAPSLFPKKFTPAFADLGQSAFGSLAIDQASRSSLMASGMGGGAANPVSEQASDMGVASDAKMIAYNPVSYSYIYKGDELDLSSVSNMVYRRANALPVNASSLLGAQVGPVNLGAFGGSQVQNFAIKQNDKNGYSVFVGDDGSVSISGNEGTWSTDYTPLTESDMPSDEKLISISNAFLDKYKIDTTSFGSPVVDRRGVNYAVMTREAGQPDAYFPDMLTVIYPLMVDGKELKQSDGSPNGINITVSARTNAVTGASIPSVNKIDRSEYEIERDAARVLAFAKRGGPWSYNPTDAEKVIEIEIGTPEVILMSHYAYQDGKGQYLMVPALKFPLLNPPKDYNQYTDSVVVPLPKDILDQSDAEPVYRIMEGAAVKEEIAQ
jgi:hypothetical protein